MWNFKLNELVLATGCSQSYSEHREGRPALGFLYQNTATVPGKGFRKVAGVQVADMQRPPPPSSLEQGLWTPAPHGWPRLCPFAFGASSDKTTDCQSLFSILSPYPFQKSSVPILPSSSLFSFKNVLPLNYCPMSLFYCLLSTSAT